MYYFRIVAFCLLATTIAAVSGCGSSSGGGFFNPVAESSSTNAKSPAFSNTSTGSGKFAIAFSVDRTSIDTTVGQVLGTATVTSSDGSNVGGRQVAFSVVAGPATITPSLAAVSTDSSGKAVTIIAPGDVASTTNVILQAATTIGGREIRAYAPFQIVRGSGVISFLTNAPTTDPSGTLAALDKTVAATFAGSSFEYMQQLPVLVTDANGNPRVGVPVTLSVEDQLTGNATIIFSNSEGSKVTGSAPTLGTVTRTTDAKGNAIFNVGVIVTAPIPRATTTDSIIYKVTTTEAAGISRLTTYAGFVASLTTDKPETANP